MEDGDTIRTYEFHANFSGSAATKESADKSGKKNKNDDDEEPNDAKEMNEELKKLITVRIKYIANLSLFISINPLKLSKHTGCHLQPFGSVAPNQSFTKRKLERGEQEESGTSDSMKKSEVQYDVRITTGTI